MKKVLLLIAVILGTSVMVNAQTAPAKTTPTKEVKATKHAKHAKHKAEKAAKMEAATEKK
ncbi:hypothetical protein [Flavobacterium cellulosilyticum]|uniref:Acid-shock protein n=1 Tax=Flavobacterium cellulosilyticum TaxID=2541731 RepID=A0A4R5CE12_9FLAO|nr:hypothetical protein [Flavobacterium cellulosilyticum]TDD96560.1 hypothetical protein E0F76_11160 [Flavobacterium cellulosilyticum]